MIPSRLRAAFAALAFAAGGLTGTVMVTPAFAHHFELGDLLIEHPYARAMLPGAKVGGGYLAVVNKGTAADRLLGATSPAAQSVQIHEMKMDGGVMQMREIKDGLPVAAGGKLELKPGGYHLMFVNPKTPFKEGEMVKATLSFEKAGTVEVEFLVGPAAGDMSSMKHEDHAQ
ncbi:hypothetical protein BJF93_08810 [Xaviernesmea oryzae]|uniref:Copper chaperone PCu(A)C n=1 Tax=Xaviernesmea oryzae TaxID=464029 RepID=A0A1Q9B151_9HYPH|nr:copper chaperone PCu(A)C [Xaviernesmea oryzae]OLP61690.1 hypothetical protein BJF93_08810 [Xaviernesmea oryzae]SEL02374.1 hypothetical protein SAMN04487976_105162 [Xaviernesmea oryzae]